ncbi:hypothetical protein [Microbacterium sp. J1-1]|uniref:hypothetical protein n=1 Tax=Microbacterium sp. J1-1 TaxID=2992441 RepID=UPI002114DD40|nr:hypothetical protein [Microbacterium sp. J1-1]UUE19317.1 hypothetical protein LRQ07_10900 [Microbacterium sp. J1-1]
MSTDVKKHQSLAAGEKPSRTALAAAILSINDVIPVANSTEATQVAVAIAASGQNLATTPVIVARADARGLHRVEITYDTAGLVWVPASGVPVFASESDANTWASSNSALLTAGDTCRVGPIVYTWTGSVWLSTDTGWQAPTFQNSWIQATPAEAVEYRRLQGMTILKGRPANGNTGTAFLLPVGYRPKHFSTFLVRSVTGSTTVSVQTSGAVELVSGQQAYLSAVAFPADA